MIAYYVQYILEPKNPKMSDWEQGFRKVKISKYRPDVKQAIIEKLHKILSVGFSIIDYREVPYRCLSDN